MKIGHKIAFIYSAMSLCIAGLIAAAIYYWMSDYTSRLYYSYLEERAYIIAQKNLEKYDTDSLYLNYIQRRTDSIGQPVLSQIILNVNDKEKTKNVLSHFITAEQAAELYNHSHIDFRHGQSLGVAVYFPKAEGNFIVIVMSGSRFGAYMHRQTGYWLLGIIGLCAAIVVLVSKLYALRRINTLDEAYHREKQFVHHASHELNNPLTAVQGECEIALLKPRQPEEYVASLKRISEESAKMTQTIRQLLYLSAASDDAQGCETERINIGNFIKQFESERVKVSASPDSSDVEATANGQLLKTAIRNIVSNALKYSDGDVEMRLEGNSLSISDHGIGIPEKELKYVFQPFFRASNTHSYKGNGIGMSLAYSILQIYKIRMSLLSKPGQGTTVRLTFGANGSIRRTTRQ